MDFSDEKLITITTQELKSLLTKGLISREKHSELRSRRRRLQNRKYARKCARKKQIEVSYLHTEIDKERDEISALRKQYVHLTDVADRFEAQRQKLIKIAENAASGVQPIIMISADGSREELHLAPPSVGAIRSGLSSNVMSGQTTSYSSSTLLHRNSGRTY